MVSEQKPPIVNLTCFHCGDVCLSDSIHIDEKIFCCEGCKTVYEILNARDLCNYYELNVQPGKSQKSVFAKNKFEYLDDAELASRLLDFSDGKVSTVTFFIPQMHCSSCIWLLENLFNLNEHILQSRVNFIEKKLSLSFQTEALTLREVVELLASIGYEPFISFDDLEKKSKSETNKTLYYKMGIAGFGFGNIMLLSFPEYLAIDVSNTTLRTTFAYVILLLSLPLFFYCGSEYFISAIKGLRKKFVNIDVPISLGIFTLFAKSVYEVIANGNPGYMDSLAGLLFFLLLGKIFQNKTYDMLNFERNYKSFFPISVTLKKSGIEKIIPLSQLKVGDRFLVRNGELIPADSILFSGKGHIDYSFVTGESSPVDKNVGETVFAGGRQTGSAIELEVLKEISQSYLTQLWNNFQVKKNEHYTFSGAANLFSKYFTFAVLGVATLSFVYWMNSNTNTAVNAFVTVLIVACPCALALSTPFTLGNTLRIFGKNNFYIKNIQVLEDLGNVDTIVWDKTGTLTENSESEIELAEGNFSQKELSKIKALAGNSMHPLSKKIYYSINEPTQVAVDTFEEIPGKGIKGIIDGDEYAVGALHLSEKMGQETSSVDFLATPINSEVFIFINGEQEGKFRIKNKYRKETPGVILNLRKEYDSYLLSGDNNTEKEYLTTLFSSEEKLRFKQSPADKQKFIQKLQSERKNVLMLGDGLNDAGALSQSNVGVSLSEDILSFSPASDGILSAKVLEKIPVFLNFTKASIRIIYASFVISILYNLIGFYFAVQGLLSPLFSAILMPLSSISVVIFTTLTTTILAKRKGLL